MEGTYPRVRRITLHCQSYAYKATNVDIDEATSSIDTRTEIMIQSLIS